MRGVKTPGGPRETDRRNFTPFFMVKIFFLIIVIISDFGIMSSEIRDDRIDQATKLVAAHMKLQNPFYAQLESMLKVAPAPSVSLSTDAYRKIEGNARIVILDWVAQGENPVLF